MNFLLGFLGAVGCLLIFAGGTFAGYRLREKQYQYERKTTAEKLTEAKRQELIEQQEAFTEMQNYNVETAYGTRDSHE